MSTSEIALTPEQTAQAGATSAPAGAAATAEPRRATTTRNPRLVACARIGAVLDKLDDASRGTVVRFIAEEYGSYLPTA